MKKKSDFQEEIERHQKRLEDIYRRILNLHKNDEGKIKLPNDEEEFLIA